MPIYLVRCRSGKERIVAEIIAGRARSKKLPVYAILFTGEIKGYIFIEASSRAVAARAVYGVQYIKSGPVSLVRIDELSPKLKREVVVENIEVGDIVEIVRGDMKGTRAKVTGVNTKTGMADLELLDNPGIMYSEKLSMLKLIDKHAEETSIEESEGL